MNILCIYIRPNADIIMWIMLGLMSYSSEFIVAWHVDAYADAGV